MPKVALISCSGRKKTYSCPANELYSKSPRFRLAYQYARLVANKIYVLSAKYGLISDETIIDPYDEFMNKKKHIDRQAWSEGVLAALKEVSDIDKDEFIIISGEAYYEYLLPHLKTWLFAIWGG